MHKLFLQTNKLKAVTIQIGFPNIILHQVNSLINKKEIINFDFNLDRSPRKSPSQRKSRQTTTNDADSAGVVSSENDE